MKSGQELCKEILGKQIKLKGEIIMLELKVYRHKEYKDIFLARNWNICGGTADTEWFYATKKILEALRSFGDKDIEEEYKFNFYNYETQHSKLKAKIEFTKEMDFDGYTGTLKKVLILPLDDFELVTLIEKED